MRFIQDILAAFMLLTRIPINWEKVSSEAPDLKRAMWAYPIVGLAVGGFAAGVYVAAVNIGIPSAVSIIFALAASILITGAFHEDGLADVADGFGGGLTREKKLEIMRDSRIGTYGGLALIMAVALKGASLWHLAPPQLIKALIVSATVSRSMIIVTALVLPPARKNSLATEAGKPSIYASIAAITLAGTTSYFLAGTEVSLILAASSFMVTLLFCWIAHRQVQGYSGDILGATQQLAEIAVLVTLATVWQSAS